MERKYGAPKGVFSLSLGATEVLEDLSNGDDASSFSFTYYSGGFLVAEYRAKVPVLRLLDILILRVGLDSLFALGYP